MKSATKKKAAIQKEGEKVGGGLSSFGEDLLQNILSKLPALSFASASCVSRSWNRLCNTILSRPKLLSALSLNPCSEVAVKEVFDTVLSEPIRPHFVIACVGRSFNLQHTHKLIKTKLGSGIPLITNVARGIIGVNALTNEFREVKWTDLESNLSEEEHNLPPNVDRGIVLIIGFVPGLKVKLIPLLRSLKEHPQLSIIDKFVMEIKDYTASVSGTTSPAGIIMFGDQLTDMKPVLEKMDYAMSKETVMIGDESGCFLYSVGDDSTITNWNPAYRSDAVALIFAKDRDKSCGFGEINFHLELSTGVLPIGPTYKAASVRVKGDSDCSTWLTARREGFFEKLDGQQILRDIERVMEDDITSNDLYIRVTKRRKCSVGAEKGRLMSFSEFHEVLGGDEEYLYVCGSGIKSGDSFDFYIADTETAFASCSNVFKQLTILKQNHDSKGSHNATATFPKGGGKEVFGGLIFTCYGRGESFFGSKHVDSTPFLETFPRVTLAGMYCGGEIGRVSSSLNQQDGQEQRSSHCCLHVYSTVYLLMSYSQEPLEH